MKKEKMTASELAYWLQGLFELQDSDAVMTQKQIDKILKKLEAVEAGKDAVETPAKAFIDFMTGVLHLASGTNDPRLFAKATTLIKNRLDDLFIHAIDPALPGDQKAHQQKHNPPNSGPRFERMC